MSVRFGRRTRTGSRFLFPAYALVIPLFITVRAKTLWSSRLTSCGSMQKVMFRTNTLALAAGPHGFTKPQKKSAGSGQGNADPLLNAAMKNMETGVWSVNGAVTFKKAIKLHGLLSGQDFDLTMDPGMKPDTPLRGIVIKD